MYSFNKEILPISAAEYSDFGPSLVHVSSDPVDMCLPGGFMDYPQTTQLEVCPSYMAQRCGELWDEKCDIYVSTLDLVKQKDFFRDVSSRKYCQLAPDSGCTTMCQPFDPIANSSVQICNNVGSENYKDANDSIDIGWYFPVNMSPDYMGGCRQTCNKVDPSKILEDDKVINGCLKYGFCNDIMNNICVLSQNNGVEISHSGLKTYCNALPKVQIQEKLQSVKLQSVKLPEKIMKSQTKREGFSLRLENVLLLLIVIIVVVILIMLLKKYYRKK